MLLFLLVPFSSVIPSIICFLSSIVVANSFHSIPGIPTLAVFNAEDKKITQDGRGAVAADPEGLDFPWLRKPLNEMNEGTASSLNEKPCLVYFTGNYQ